MRFLRKLFRGRVGRTSFFIYALYLIFLPYAPYLYQLAAELFYEIFYRSPYGYSHYYSTDIPFEIALILILFLSIPFLLIPICIRRLYTIGWSRWLTVLIVIPIVNLFFTLLLILMPEKRQEEEDTKGLFYRKVAIVLLNLIFFAVLAFIIIGYFTDSRYFAEPIIPATIHTTVYI